MFITRFSWQKVVKRRGGGDNFIQVTLICVFVTNVIFTTWPDFVYISNFFKKVSFLCEIAFLDEIGNNNGNKIQCEKINGKTTRLLLLKVPIPLGIQWLFRNENASGIFHFLRQIMQNCFVA